jgi:hypothetical protein
MHGTTHHTGHHTGATPPKHAPLERADIPDPHVMESLRASAPDHLRNLVTPDISGLLSGLDAQERLRLQTNLRGVAGAIESFAGELDTRVIPTLEGLAQDPTKRPSSNLLGELKATIRAAFVILEQQLQPFIELGFVPLVEYLRDVDVSLRESSEALATIDPLTSPHAVASALTKASYALRRGLSHDTECITPNIRQLLQSLEQPPLAS